MIPIGSFSGAGSPAETELDLTPAGAGDGFTELTGVGRLIPDARIFTFFYFILIRFDCFNQKFRDFPRSYKKDLH